jgi:copper oxidase (laccase) domain-containing protein
VHLDLRSINRQQLLDAGVSDIWVSPECTFCAADRFLSVRREKEQAGRMMSFIGWKAIDHARGSDCGAPVETA